MSSSLPLVWGGRGDIRGQLADPARPHWAMQVLNKRGRVVPLDTLAGPKGLGLPRDALLVLVQPRPFMPEENVALDEWVRGGGHVLLFVDPMLTHESDFALGDPRRPEAMAMLSPILRHWGLDLQFDHAQPTGERQAEALDVSFPIDLAGRFAALPGSRCRIDANALAADCRIGRGRVVALADAAVFDGEDAGRIAALGAFVDISLH